MGSRSPAVQPGRALLRAAAEALGRVTQRYIMVAWFVTQLYQADDTRECQEPGGV